MGIENSSESKGYDDGSGMTEAQREEQKRAWAEAAREEEILWPVLEECFRLKEDHRFNTSVSPAEVGGVIFDAENNAHGGKELRWLKIISATLESYIEDSERLLPIAKQMQADIRKAMEQVDNPSQK